MFRKIKKWWNERRLRKLNKELLNVDDDYFMDDEYDSAVLDYTKSGYPDNEIDDADMDEDCENEICDDTVEKSSNKINYDNQFIESLCSERGDRFLGVDTTNYPSIIPFTTLMDISNSKLFVHDFKISADKVQFKLKNSLKEHICYRNGCGVFNAEFETRIEQPANSTQASRQHVIMANIGIAIPIHKTDDLDYNDTSIQDEDYNDWCVIEMSTVVKSSFIVTSDSDGEELYHESIKNIMLKTAKSVIERATSCVIAKRSFRIPAELPDIFETDITNMTAHKTTRMIRTVRSYSTIDTKIDDMVNNFPNNDLIKPTI